MSGLQPHAAQDFAHTLLTLRRRRAYGHQRLGNGRTDPQPGIQRRKRILKDHLQPAGIPCVIAARHAGQYGFTVEKDFPARRRKKPHSHARQCRLAAPGLAHQAERLAATYGKRYAIHCANFAPHSPEHTLPHRKRTAHITKIKKRRRGGRHAYSEAEKETEKRQTRKSASILVPFLVKKLVFYH